jgi:putative heme-binding domain-containing protein
MAEIVPKCFAVLVAALLLPLMCRPAEARPDSSSLAETNKGQPSVEQLLQMLRSDDLAAQVTAANVAAKHADWSQVLDEPLRKIAFDAKQPNALRVAALAALAPRLFPVDMHLFELVRSNLTIENPPIFRLTAARTLASLRLIDMQMLSVAKSVGEADGLVLPTLVGAFTRTSNDAAGLSLVIALGKTSAAASLSADELAHVLRHYSVGVRAAAKPLLEQRYIDLDKQRDHLEELAPLLEGGDPGSGREVFSSEKAGCSSCHNINGSESGGLLGPNLGLVGKTRNGKEILDSIIYPGAGTVPGFEPFKCETMDGQEYTGVVTQEGPDAIWIRNKDTTATKVETRRIKTMTGVAMTVMPKRIEDSLTKNELRDLLAYLESLK